MSLFHAGLQPALDSNGNPISGATWVFYLTGTVTPAPVYSDAGLTTSLGSVVTADSAGRFAVIFLDDATQYRAIRKDASGNTITDVDPVTGSSPGFRNVRAYGAVGDGVADDRAAIQAAIDAAEDDGGGTVFIPNGTYRLTPSTSGAHCLSPRTGVFIVGEGFGTVLKRADNSTGAQVVSAEDVTNFGICNLCIDGNRDNNSASGHGLRLASVSYGLFQNLLIRKPISYCIGIQDGTNKHLKFDNIWLEDSGQDGIDIKNKGTITLDYDTGTGAFAIGDTVTGATSGTSFVVLAVDGDTTSGTLTISQEMDHNEAGALTNDGVTFQDFTDNENLQVGGVTKAKANGTLQRDQNENIQISNISVMRWGLNNDASAEAGIDCRGRIIISNVYMAEPGTTDCTGLRFRQGELLDINGTGGHESVATGIDINMEDSANAQAGIFVAARNVTANDGSVAYGKRCVMVLDTGFKSNLRVTGADDIGCLISSQATDPGLTPDKTCLTGFRAISCGSHGIEVQAGDCDFIGCQAETNGGYGLHIVSGANRAKVLGGVYGSNNTSGRISDASGTATIIGVEGFATTITGLSNAVDDAAAATASVPVSGLYRNGSVLMIRVA